MNQIDHYQIIEKIGEGGMGEVYKGLDIMLEREVAIKLMRPELSNRPEIVDRFRTEAIALGRLNHSNIATVYNFGKAQNQYYIALEFVSGETLDGIIKKSGKLPWQTALNYAIAALEGLEHAHQLNIIHRDIKPANIMINEKGIVKIMDFGIARILGKARMTQTGRFIGTLEYMPPEQIQGKEADARSDIYSMGAVLYEMLTGHVLFERDTEFELMNSQISEKPKPIREFNQEIPLELEKAVLRALEKDSGKRYTSALELSQLLRKLLLNESTKFAPTQQNAFIAFCKDYPAIVIAASLLLPAGSYALWQLSSTDSLQDITEQTSSTIVQQAPELSLHEVVDNNQRVEEDKNTVVASINLPEIDSPALILSPETPFPPAIDKVEEESIFDDTSFRGIPIPERKPATPEYFLQLVKQPMSSTPSQRNIATKTTSTPAREQPEDDPQIDKWAEEFFRN
jgi:eukaryotic-like serine/threonine-protein kinase